MKNTLYFLLSVFVENNSNNIDMYNVLLLFRIYVGIRIYVLQINSTLTYYIVTVLIS